MRVAAFAYKTCRIAGSGPPPPLPDPGPKAANIQTAPTTFGDM